MKFDGDKSRWLTFSREIARRRSDVCGADPLSFLSSQLGNKFGSVQTRGLGGERAYRLPGQFFRHTSYNSMTQLCMSFDFKQLAQSVQSLLSQIHTTQFFAWGGNTLIENKTTSYSRGELAQVTKLSLVTRWSGAAQSSLATEWSHAVHGPPSMYLQPAVWMRSSQVLRRLQVMQSPQSMFTPQSVQRPQPKLLQPSVRSPREYIVRVPVSQATKSGETKTYTTERLFTLTKLATWNTERTRHDIGSIQTIADVHRHVLVKTTYVCYPGDKSFGPHLSLASSSLTSLHEVTGQRWLKTVMRQRLFTPQQSAIETRLVFEKRSGFLRSKQISVRPGSLHAGFVFISQAMLTNRSQFKTKLIECELFPGKGRSLAGEVKSNLQPASELVLVGKEEGTSRAPSMDFVFAQAFRQKISEERVVKHQAQREIVELVRKEVNQSMTRVSPLQDFTREDYVEISDHVYSALMKRLTAEKERLGLR